MGGWVDGWTDGWMDGWTDHEHCRSTDYDCRKLITTVITKWETRQRDINS